MLMLKYNSSAAVADASLPDKMLVTVVSNHIRDQNNWFVNFFAYFKLKSNRVHTFYDGKCVEQVLRLGRTGIVDGSDC